MYSFNYNKFQIHWKTYYELFFYDFFSNKTSKYRNSDVYIYILSEFLNDKKYIFVIINGNGCLFS